MPGRGTEADTHGRAVVYCVVPGDLAAKLHEPLRTHFRDEPGIEVVVEQRRRDRRRHSDRRAAEPEPAPADRRLIQALEGRRVADRRAVAVVVDAPHELPRRARPHAAQLLFVERLEPTTRQSEDVDTARLVAHVQSGNRDAFAELYMRYFDRVYGYLRVALNDAHEAEDATQHVFANVFEAIGRYQRSRAPFRAWLFAIVRNHAITLVKQRSRVALVGDEAIASHRDAGDGGDDLRALDWISDRELLMFVERLPLSQRQVLMLRFMLDFDYGEVAVLLGRSRDDVRMLQSRALTFIRARLTALGRSPSRPRTPMLRRPGQAVVARGRRFALLRGF